MTKLQNIDEERSLCFDLGGYEFDEDDTIESSDIYTSSDDDSDDVISIDSNSNDNNSLHSREVISKKRKRRKPSRRGRSGYPTPFSDNDSNRLRRSALNLNAIAEEPQIDDSSNQEESSQMSTTQHTSCESSQCSEYSIQSSSSHLLPYTFIKTDLMGREVQSIVGNHSHSFRKSGKTNPPKTSKWKTVLFEPSSHSGSDLSSYSRAGTPPSLKAPTKNCFSQSFRTLKNKFPSATAAAPTSSWKPKTSEKSLEKSLTSKMPARPSSYLQLDFGLEDSADSEFGKISTSQKELSTVELVTSALSAVELVSSEQHSKKKKNSCSNKRSQKGTTKSKPIHKNKSKARIKSSKTKAKPTYRTTPTKQQSEGSNHGRQFHFLDTSSNSTQTESTHSITSHSSNTIDNIDEPSSISPRHLSSTASNSLASPWSKSLSLPSLVCDHSSSSKPTMLYTNSPLNKNDTPTFDSHSNNPDRPPVLPKRRSKRNSRRNSGVSSRRSGMRNSSIPAGDLGVFSGLSIRSKKRRKKRHS